LQQKNIFVPAVKQPLGQSPFITTLIFVNIGQQLAGEFAIQSMWTNKRINTFIRTHREIRESSLLSLKELRTSEGNITSAEIIRKIIRKVYHDQYLANICTIKDPTIPSQPSKQEHYQKQWKHINPTFHPPTRSALNTIEIPHLDQDNQLTTDPDQAVKWKTITDPVQIEE
jgi:hypothetical protein